MQDALEGGRPALVAAIQIMRFTRTVEADPDQEAILGEELAPRIVQQRAVGLQGVLGSRARAGVLLLVRHRLAEKVQAHQGRFAALPGKVDFWGALSSDVLAGVIFQRLVRHAEGRARI